MNDRLVGEAASRSLNCTAERDWPKAAQFTKGLIPAPTFDGTGHSLRNEQPPRDDVSVPGIDDDLHLLVKEVAIEHARSNHGG